MVLFIRAIATIKSNEQNEIKIVLSFLTLLFMAAIRSFWIIISLIIGFFAIRFLMPQYVFH